MELPFNQQISVRVYEYSVEFICSICSQRKTLNDNEKEGEGKKEGRKKNKRKQRKNEIRRQRRGKVM